MQASPKFLGHPTYAQKVDKACIDRLIILKQPKATKSGMVARGIGVFLAGHPRPSPKAPSASIPTFLGPPTCVHTVGETATKFGLVIKLEMMKIFAQLTTNTYV